jgi:CheY-like chemotaxis protein
MSPQFSARQFSDLRDDVQQVVESARDQESDIQALATAAQRDIRHAEAALSRTRGLPVDQLREVLDAQLQRSVADAAAARQLCVHAREQHDAARRLLTRLDANRTAAERRIRHRPRRDAVLVVDDYDDVREVVALALQNIGFIVRTAANGLEGLIAAYEMRPAVIVMDVTMPVLDGIEATRLIKATKATRHARVIAHTGQPAFDDRVAETLFAAVLEKPATIDAVLATVQHVAGM